HHMKCVVPQLLKLRQPEYVRMESTVVQQLANLNVVPRRGVSQSVGPRHLDDPVDGSSRVDARCFDRFDPRPVQVEERHVRLTSEYPRDLSQRVPSTRGVLDVMRFVVLDMLAIAGQGRTGADQLALLVVEHVSTWQTALRVEQGVDVHGLPRNYIDV